MPKVRLDVLLVERGLAESRAKAQAMIMAGQVRVARERAVGCVASHGAARGRRGPGNDEGPRPRDATPRRAQRRGARVIRR